MAGVAGRGTELVPAISTGFGETDDVRGEKRLALIVGGAFFVGFLGWAALTPLDAGAYAPGVVAVAGNRQSVQHRDGGTIAALYVRDGQKVARGQPLVAISDGAIEASERGLTREHLMLLAERARLDAERNRLATIAPPAEFAGLSVADQTIAAEALREQATLLAARRASVGQQKRVLGQQAMQSEARIRGYGAQLAANAEQRRLVQDELAGMKTLAEKGFASMNRIRALERSDAGLGGDAGSLMARMAEAREAIGQSRMQALALDGNVIEDVDTRLREVATRLNEVQPQRTAARERLSATVLRAPAPGRVVGLSVFTVGGIIQPGQLLMEIVPDDQELVVQARLSPDDADDVEPGMVTEVRFPSLRDANLPMIEGQLTTISADSLTEERSGATYFSAEVRVGPDQLKRIAAARPGRPPVQAGVPVEVLVRLQKRSVLDYLFEPLSRALWRSGREH
jgi:HlyD family type I secretion membrane fusion protein